ncbi:hypothetical protein [Thermospira aquatica]|uniref:Condensation domain-containing protein n=1 Tax=Thermospira aquatica TaxID=2828656 RepID=A0AAX3BFA5_9SPIR|nr:hypothetical protein [Thermospira aquatica]URA10952.1 hypothetical protein KDW03_03875 [Thermospira aquatica]
MTRTLFPIEEWIYRASRRTFTPLPINFGFAVELLSPINPEELKIALQKVGEVFPFSLARVILYPHKRGILTTEETKPIPLFYQKTNNPWENIARELPRPFDDPYEPLLRVFLYERETENQLLYVHFDHALADGISALLWLKILFAILQNQKPPVPPCIDIENLLQNHFSHEWEKQYTSSRRSMADTLKKNLEVLFQPSWPKELHYTIQTAILDTQTTQKLKQKAKEEGSSVHAALSVSFLQAFYERGFAHHRPYRTVLSPVDLRKKYHLPRGYGLLNGTLRTSVDFLRKESFWEKCRRFKQDLDLQYKNTDFLYSHYRAGKDLEKALLHGFSKRPRFDTRKDYDLSLTNVGVIEPDFFQGRIQRVYGPIAQGLPTETVLGVSTYADELTLTWVSKPEFMPDETSTALFQRGKEILFSAIGD